MSVTMQALQPDAGPLAERLLWPMADKMMAKAAEEKVSCSNHHTAKGGAALSCFY